METPHIYEERELLVYREGAKREAARHPIVKEVPLTILLNGEELATVLCSPHSPDTLAIGFLVGEGILQNRGDVKEIVCRPEQGTVWVDTTGGEARPGASVKRDPAGCCGKGRPWRLLNGYEQVRPVAHATRFAARDVQRWAALLDEEARTFRLTGGVHEAALAHEEGFAVYYEDIGRHNALNRVLGYTFLNDVDPSDKAVILSSRISAEVLTKVARIGVPLVVSRAAVTCLAIDLAEQLGITLVGFARGSSLNVYAHAGRIVE